MAEITCDIGTLSVSLEKNSWDTGWQNKYPVSQRSPHQRETSELYAHRSHEATSKDAYMRWLYKIWTYPRAQDEKLQLHQTRSYSQKVHNSLDYKLYENAKYGQKVKRQMAANQWNLTIRTTVQTNSSLLWSVESQKDDNMPEEANTRDRFKRLEEQIEQVTTKKEFEDGTYIAN